jgi:PAS domain S-box-containing protein
MMKNRERMTLGVGFTLAITILIVDGAVSAWNIRNVAGSNRLVVHSLEVLSELAALISAAKDAETGQRGFLITGRDAYLGPFQEAVGRLGSGTARLKELTAGDSGQEARLALVERLLGEKIAELRETIRLRREQGFAAAREMVLTDKGKAAMDELRRLVGEMKAAERAVLERLDADSAASLRRTISTLGIATLVALAAMIALYWQVRRAERILSQQREWFRVTLRSIGDGVIATDARGRVTFMNPVAEALCGRTLDDVAGQPLEAGFSIVREGTREPVENPVQKVLKHGVVVGLANHTLLIAADGKERPIDDSGAPIQEEGGAITGVVLVFRDISRRRQAEAAMARLAAIVESSEDAIIGKTLEGVITSWNAGAERLFGYTASEALGRPITLLIPPDRQQEEAEILARVARGERVEHFESVRVGKDGRLIDVSLVVSPIRDNSGQVVGASKIARDITERRRLEDELRKQANELREASRRKDEFLAMLAHELRNPLASIDSAVSLLTLSGAPEHVEWSREVIDRNVRHLARLIDDLLDVSRISHGKIELRRQLLDLATVTDHIVEAIRPLVKERSQELHVTVPRGSLWLEADPTRLEQIVTNLLSNAVQYSGSGSRIWLSAGFEGETIALMVRDNGIGIPPALLPHVFELFTQGDRSLARSEGGLGIGLTMVKMLTELHGGTVTAATDRPGGGCEFVVRLPAGRRAAPQARPRHDPAPTRRQRGNRILVVDDNVDLARSMVDLLSLFGYQVLAAYDGLSAIEEARVHHPDAVLLDIGLPGIDGYEVARRLRNEQGFQEVLIIAITGYGQEEDSRRSRDAGFNHHLVKPVDFDVLKSLLAAPMG